MEIVQQKTNTQLLIPVHPRLEQEIAQSPKEHKTFLQTQFGNQSSDTGFYNVFKDWVKESGLPSNLSPHGLRKAAARRLAEAGCSAHEIAAITGHKTLAEVERYTRAVNQSILAKKAITKID